jgi:hypothetical protein
MFTVTLLTAAKRYKKKESAFIHECTPVIPPSSSERLQTHSSGCCTGEVPGAAIH